MWEHLLRILQEKLEKVKVDSCEVVEDGLRCEHDGMLAGLEDVTNIYEKRKADLNEVGERLQQREQKSSSEYSLLSVEL